MLINISSACAQISDMNNYVALADNSLPENLVFQHQRDVRKISRALQQQNI